MAGVTLTQILGKEIGAEIEKNPRTQLLRENVMSYYFNKEVKLAASSGQQAMKQLEDSHTQAGLNTTYLGLALQMRSMESWQKEKLLAYVVFALRCCDEAHFNVMDCGYTFVKLEHAYSQLNEKYSLNVRQVCSASKEQQNMSFPELMKAIA